MTATVPSRTIPFLHPARVAIEGLALLLSLLCGVASAADVPPERDYTEPIRRLERVIDDELKRGLISGVSIALVDDQRIVYANGFGYADKQRRLPATPNTIYRAG